MEAKVVENSVRNFTFIYLALAYLPVTAYVKLIDVWLIFSMTIPFLEVQ